jgi:hypothetical protein
MLLLRAAWDILEEVVAALKAEPRKGPRGGGRDRDEIWHHVIDAERAYARKIGVRHKPFEMNDKSACSPSHAGRDCCQTPQALYRRTSV